MSAINGKDDYQKSIEIYSQVTMKNPEALGALSRQDRKIISIALSNLTNDLKEVISESDYKSVLQDLKVNERPGFFQRILIAIENLFHSRISPKRILEQKQKFEMDVSAQSKALKEMSILKERLSDLKNQGLEIEKSKNLYENWDVALPIGEDSKASLTEILTHLKKSSQAKKEKTSLDWIVMEMGSSGINQEVIENLSRYKTFLNIKLDDYIESNKKNVEELEGIIQRKEGKLNGVKEKVDGYFASVRQSLDNVNVERKKMQATLDELLKEWDKLSSQKYQCETILALLSSSKPEWIFYIHRRFQRSLESQIGWGTKILQKLSELQPEEKPEGVPWDQSTKAIRDTLVACGKGALKEIKSRRRELSDRHVCLSSNLYQLIEKKESLEKLLQS